MSTTLTFLGASETVTGSRYLVETGRARILVDCGLFQGWKKLRARNWAPLPFAASSLDAVVFTHAHIDHTGYFPRLCTSGFEGSAYCTLGTRDLLRILLPDAGFLQEEQARHANQGGYSKHNPALPLYTRRDAERSLRQLKAKPYGQRFDVVPGISVRFRRAGHILGSACVELTVEGTAITFTGDVGRPSDPIMKAPETLGDAHYLVTESTYGDRRHTSKPVEDSLQQIVCDTVDRGGVILVPAFAVGRAQHLLHAIAGLKAARRIPDIPVYLDSPMAINATELFLQHRDDHRLSDAQCRAMCAAARYSHGAEESKAIARQEGPMIVLSASGMASGGRILHHLARCLPREQDTVLFTGYQAAGTRGRALVDGTDEIKIHGRYVPVAARVAQLEGLSAHADYHEMLEWLAAGTLAPRRAFVTHGEPSAADAFRRRLRDTFSWEAVVPEEGSQWRVE